MNGNLGYLRQNVAAFKNNSWFEDETNLLLGDNSLAVFDTVRDLGVIVDSNLFFLLTLTVLFQKQNNEYI